MSKHFRPLIAALCGATVLVFAGCGEDVGPTGATCPQGGTTLTYENFGRSFLDQRCNNCHSSKLSGITRQGAPEGWNFDTVESVRTHSSGIDAWAGSGPNRTNTEMPPGAKPTTEDRKKLSEWLACGAP